MSLLFRVWLAWLFRRWRPRTQALAAAGVVAMIAFWIYCGVVGIDFGFHWDEGYEVDGVRTSVKKLLVLPQWYVYGSVYFLVGLGVVMAHHLRFVPAFLEEMRTRTGTAITQIETYRSVQDFQHSALGFIDSPRYILETRMAFLCLSSLTGLWVYLILRKLYPKRYLGALAAAAFIVFSWELQYHARFIAMDTLLTQIIAAQLLLLVHAALTPSPRGRLLAYCGAAAAAGFAFSCKAPGLVAILPLGLFPFLVQGRLSLLGRVARAALGWLIAAVTALVLQPALLVDPLRFVATLGAQSYQYTQDVAHPGYTPGALHRMMEFLAWLWLALPSPYLTISLLMSAVTVFGLCLLARRHWRVALLGGVLAGTLFIMMIAHPLLIVRQYLMLSSLLAVGFGLGIMDVYDRLAGWAWARHSLLVALAVSFFLDGRFLYAAAVGIRDLTDEEVHRQATDELLRRPRPVRLSPKLAATLAPRLGAGYRCHGDSKDARAEVAIVVRASEHPWRANMFGFARHSFGSREVNYDWYPTWVGRRERSPILILSPKHARAQDLPIGRYTACDPGSHD